VRGPVEYQQFSDVEVGAKFFGYLVDCSGMGAFASLQAAAGNLPSIF
jgi:hypothetical protein